MKTEQELLPTVAEVARTIGIQGTKLHNAFRRNGSLSLNEWDKLIVELERIQNEVYPSTIEWAKQQRAFTQKAVRN